MEKHTPFEMNAPNFRVRYGVNEYVDMIMQLVYAIIPRQCQGRVTSIERGGGFMVSIVLSDARHFYSAETFISIEMAQAKGRLWHNQIVDQLAADILDQYTLWQ